MDFSGRVVQYQNFKSVFRLNFQTVNILEGHRTEKYCATSSLVYVLLFSFLYVHFYISCTLLFKEQGNNSIFCLCAGSMCV